MTVALLEIGRERLEPDRKRRRVERSTKRRRSHKYPVRRGRKPPPVQDISARKPVIIRRESSTRPEF